MEIHTTSKLTDLSRGGVRIWEKRFARINRLFLLTVILPTTLAAIYFGLIASDVYISESKFVIRGSQRQATTGLGALLQGSAFTRSLDDTYSVNDFMLSRNALEQLNNRLSLGMTFGQSNIDIFNRFDGFGWDNSFEALFRYYQKQVVIEIDTVSSISSLKVSAFKAEDAYRINELLMQQGEYFVNKLSERARQDLVDYATSEVSIAEKKAKDSALAVSGYRDKKEVFDPERQSLLQLQQISKLQDGLIAAKTQLAQVRHFTPENPQIPVLQKRVESFQSEIDSEMHKVVGSSVSLSSKATEYERLVLERAFADKQLSIALTSLEQARSDAQRKQLYLERIVQPNKPDVAVEPRRLKGILVTFILGLVLWGILTILIAGVREHRD